MIIGIGTDIIEIGRVEEATKNLTFMNKLFSDEERVYLSGKPAESAAGYFCAKEAVSKALGTGFVAMAFTDIEIVKNNSVPSAVLHGGAKIIADKLGVKKIFLTISHCREYATATAVLEG